MVAEVTAEPRLRMTLAGPDHRRSRPARSWTPTVPCSPPRPASPHPREKDSPFRPRTGRGRPPWRARWLAALGDLNTCSQRGLNEKFDCTIGAASVLLPYGGKHRRTPAECMVAKLPVTEGETRSASAMSHGFLPSVSRWSPFHGAVWAHVQAAAKLAAAGADHRRLRFTLQEYFGKPLQDPLRWGAPLAALLGALQAELTLGTAAIGGKDSMSGTFQDLDVPPTLVAFAVDLVKADEVVSSELKGPGHDLVLLELPRTADELPDWQVLDALYGRLGRLVREGRLLAARTVGMDGLAPALSIMAFGNGVGFQLDEELDWFQPRPGSFVVELPGQARPDVLFDGLDWTLLGTTLDQPEFRIGGTILPLAEAQAAWEAPSGTGLPHPGVRRRGGFGPA